MSRLVLLPFLLVPLLTGCGPSMGQVEGKVVWSDGSPASELARGQVVFESPAMRITSRGEIGADGSFKLRTANPGDGAQVGEYEVCLVENRMYTAGEGSPLAPQRLHEKYSDFKTSGLKATVTSGTNTVTLTLERLGGKK